MGKRAGGGCEDALRLWPPDPCGSTVPGTSILEESAQRSWENMVPRDPLSTSSLPSAWPGNSSMECGHARLNASTFIKKFPSAKHHRQFTEGRWTIKRMHLRSQVWLSHPCYNQTVLGLQRACISTLNKVRHSETKCSISERFGVKWKHIRISSGDPGNHTETKTAESAEREHPSSILPKVTGRDGWDHGSRPWVRNAGMTLNKSGVKENFCRIDKSRVRGREVDYN